MKILRTLLILLLIIVIGIVLFLGYLGFIPGLSTFFGSDKPRDLGIKYTQTDYDLAMQKNKVGISVINFAPSAQASLIWQGTNQVSNSWRAQEVMATINKNSSDWKFFPIKDVQLKINSDGSVEASGILSVDKLKGYAEATKISQGDINSISKILDDYKIPRNPVPFYIKGSLSVKNNNVNVEVPKLEIGRLPIPQSLYESAKSSFEGFAKQQLDGGGYGNLYIKSLDFNNGKMNFDGTLPAAVTVAKEAAGF